jgi:hypothetical protein
MTPLWAFLALCLAAALPAADSTLGPSLEKARLDFVLAGQRSQAAEAEAAPLAAKVRQLKAVEDPWWWTRWRLRRNLGLLQESLDRLREARSLYEAARQELFLVLSALEEELRSALNRELSRPRARKEELRRLLARKADYGRELEAIGFGEGKPFPLVDVPGQPSLPLLRVDRLKALQARAIQLEAWSATVSDDLRLLRRARDSGALGAAAAGARLRELEALKKRIQALIRDNETQLLSKN